MNKTLLAYFSFVLACVVVIAGFITATNYIQLAVVILLYPVLVFFAYKVLPPKWKQLSKKSETANQSILKEVSPSSAKSAETVEETKGASVGISDIDKRVFLKLIGSAGVFLFLLSIFNKKSESLFFKNLPGQVSGSVALENTAGNKIDPAQSQPLDGYQLSEFDDNDDIAFYGFINKNGDWYIMRINTNAGSIHYTKDNSNFPGNWGNRQNLKYDYFNNIF